MRNIFILLLPIIIFGADVNAFHVSPYDTITYRTNILDEIVVSTHKHLFKYSANKFEYNIAGDSTLQNANLLQALKRIPILEVEGDDRISSMEGLPLVYKINGLRDPMLSGDISQVLAALPSALISKVQLTKVANEDKGTVMEVNIVTKSRLEGYRAQMSTSLTDQSWRNGIWGMSKVRRFNFSGNYFNTWVYGHDMTSGIDEIRTICGEERYFRDVTKSGPYRTDHNNVEISASYDTDDSSFLSIYARGLIKADPRQDSFTTRLVTDHNDRTLLAFVFENKTRYRDSEYEAVARWEKIFLNQNHPAYFNVGYEFYNRPTRSNETGIYYMDYIEENSMIDNVYDFRHTAVKSYSTHTLQTDGSYDINNNNRIGIFGKLRFRREVWNNDVEKKYVFSSTKQPELLISNTNLREIFGSIFPKYTYLGQRWETTLGIFTQLYRHSVWATDIGDKIINKRISILPYVRAAFITRNRLLLELIYEMKSQVPNITALDPYINTDKPGEISYGNPHLKPQKSHDIEFRLSKTMRKFYTSVYVSCSLTEDIILSRIFLSEGTLNRTFGNIGKRRTYNFGGYTSGRLFPKTFLRLSAEISRIAHYSSTTDDNNAGVQWVLSARCEQELPWNIYIDSNAGFNSSAVMLQGRGPSNFNYGLSIYKTFLAGSINVLVNASSFFPIWYKKESTIQTENYNSKSWTRTFHAYFGLNLSYSFGKLRANVKQTSFSINNNDIKKDYHE